jgi:hypothetical protein
MHASVIDTSFDLNLRSNGEQLQKVFDNKFPTWPAYQAWISRLRNDGQDRCIFGPIVPPPRPIDYLPWASFETLRAIARKAGVRCRRSKKETALALRAEVDTSLLVTGASEGRNFWNKYIWLPYSRTPFAVLEHTIRSIEMIGRTCELALNDLVRRNLLWITNGGKSVCVDCREVSNTAIPAVVIGERPESVPPRHPGCTCAVAFQ